MNLIQSLSTIDENLLVPTPDGAYTIKYKDRLVHSARSPLKEAKKLLNGITMDTQNTLVIVWGVGLGYHVEMLVQQGFKVLAIENRPLLAEIFKQNFPIETLVDFVEDPSTIFDVLVNLDSKQFRKFIDVSMVGFPISTDVWRLKTQGITALQSLHAIKQNLVESWYLNIIQNISAKDVYYTLDAIFKGQNLVICSAGPSLKESLPYIKKHRESITLLAVDTAMLTLVQYGLIPDYVHSVDAKIHNIADFRGIDSKIFSQMILIADIVLSHQVLSLPWKEKLLVSTAQPINTKDGLKISRHSLQQFLWDNGVRLPETQTGGSVATSAFYLGLLYQAQNIYLVGQDLAYSQHRGHSVGSPYDMEYRLQTNRLRSFDTIHISKVPFDDPEVIDLQNKKTYADPLLNQFRSWFEVSLKDNPQLSKISFNASENGALFEYWTHRPLSSIDKMPPSKKHHYQRLSLQNIYPVLQQLKDIENPVFHDYFYNELLTPKNNPDETSKKIQRKTQMWYKKLEKALCQ